jgi:hypothetical protein
MPVVDIKLNLMLPDATVQALAAEFGGAVRSCFEKTCPSVMVSFSNGPLFVDGSAAPAAWIVVRSAMELGIETKRRLCQQFSEILASRCAVAPERVFLFLSRVMPQDAWNLSPAGPTCVADRSPVDNATRKLPAQAASTPTT